MCGKLGTDPRSSIPGVNLANEFPEVSKVGTENTAYVPHLQEHSLVQNITACAAECLMH